MRSISFIRTKTYSYVSYVCNESINLEVLIDILNHVWLKTRNSDKSILGMTLDKNRITFGIAYGSGTLLLGVVSVIARLSIGLFVIVVRKAVFEGGPRTMEMGLWLRDQTFVFFVKSHKSLNPRVREVGKILKALIIIVVRNLKIKGGPKIIATGQIINRECRLLIETTVKRKEKLDSTKKHQEISPREQVKENISPGMISANEPIQRYKEPDIFGDNHED